MRTPRPVWLLAFCLVPGLAGGCGSTGTTSDATAEGCPKLILDSLHPIDDPPDGAAACGAGDCNYQTQVGCPDDQACRPQFNATEPDVHPGCETAGTVEAGEACTAQGDCVRGAYCAAGTCRKLCCGADWTGCNAGESCIRGLDVRAGGAVISAEAGLCFPINTCDPLDAKSCADEPSRECKIVDPTGAVACAPRSIAELGEECAPPTVCRQGATCVGEHCIKLCRFEECGEPSCSEAEGTCVRFLRDPEGVGECTLGR